MLLNWDTLARGWAPIAGMRFSVGQWEPRIRATGIESGEYSLGSLNARMEVSVMGNFVSRILSLAVLSFVVCLSLNPVSPGLAQTSNAEINGLIIDALTPLAPVSRAYK